MAVGKWFVISALVTILWQLKFRIICREDFCQGTDPRPSHDDNQVLRLLFIHLFRGRKWGTKDLVDVT